MLFTTRQRLESFSITTEPIEKSQYFESKHLPLSGQNENRCPKVRFSLPHNRAHCFCGMVFARHCSKRISTGYDTSTNVNLFLPKACSDSLNRHTIHDAVETILANFSDT